MAATFLVINLETGEYLDREFCIWIGPLEPHPRDVFTSADEAARFASANAPTDQGAWAIVPSTIPSDREV